MDCSLSQGANGYLDALYEEYERFDVQQTTVEVDPDEFAVIEQRPECVAVRVRIENDGNVIAVPDGEGWTFPGGVIDDGIDPATIASSVEQWTGLEVQIEGVERVSLVCLQCRSTEEELWTVSAVFSARATGGSPRNGAVWRSQSTPITVPSTP